MEFTYLVSSRGPGVAEGRGNRFGSISSLPRRPFALPYTLTAPPADIVSSSRSSSHTSFTDGLWSSEHFCFSPRSPEVRLKTTLDWCTRNIIRTENRLRNRFVISPSPTPRQRVFFLSPIFSSDTSLYRMEKIIECTEKRIQKRSESVHRRYTQICNSAWTFSCLFYFISNAITEKNFTLNWLYTQHVTLPR